MKIAVLNYSGNVGKTTLSRDMLYYNLQNYDLVTIESVNSDGKEKVIIRGEDGDKIYTELLVTDDLILDIGSSNLENYLKNSEIENELISSIDLFVIPVTAEKKQQADTLKTVRDIVALGASNNIAIVFNQIDDKTDVEEVFSNLISALIKLKVNVNPENTIFRHDLYSRGQELSEMITDDDFKTLILEAKQAGDNKLAREYADHHIRQTKVNRLIKVYSNIFDNLMKIVGEKS